MFGVWYLGLGIGLPSYMICSFSGVRSALDIL